MVTITKVEEFTKKNGKKGWKFFLSDGKDGFITNDKPWEYKKDELVDYSLEVRKTPNGGEYNLLTLTRVGDTMNTPHPQAKEPTPQSEERLPPANKAELSPLELLQLKVELRKRVIQVIGEVAAAGRIEPKDMAEYYNEFYLATDASLDELCK